MTTACHPAPDLIRGLARPHNGATRPEPHEASR
jgi:hypothetical protein